MILIWFGNGYVFGDFWEGGINASTAKGKRGGVEYIELWGFAPDPTSFSS